jgi:hypothetical protein
MSGTAVMCTSTRRYLLLGAPTTGRSVIVIPEEMSVPQQLFVYEHDAGRLELLVRILYWILIGIVMWVYGIIAGICFFIQWFWILIFGNRNEMLANVAKGYLEYMVHVMPYTYFMTDTRPDIMPVTVKILEEY